MTEMALDVELGSWVRITRRRGGLFIENRWMRVSRFHEVLAVVGCLVY